jgi:hypothetical protein
MKLLTEDFIYREIEQQRYEISLHADDERLADGLTVIDLEVILSRCKIIEYYLDDPRGESCLVAGFTESAAPVHMVCGLTRAGRLLLITVYIPALPKWRDPFTRNRGQP